MHLLFLCHPDHGHVIPGLAVVTELVRRGHRVTYLTAPSMAEVVTDAGATALTYPSRYRDADFGAVAEDPGYLMDLLLDESTAMLDVELPERPDAVVYDTSILFAGRVLARRLGVPAVQVIPVFASNEHYSYLNSMYAPDRPVAERPSEPPAWVMSTMQRIGALCAKHGVSVAPPELWFDVPPLSLVTVPRAFQFAGDTFDSRFEFVGPCVGDRGFLGSWEPPSSGLPVALVSLGAVFNEHADFFRTCVEAFRGKPWHAVVTVADAVDPASLGELPSNVEVHRWVPHVAVLEHAALCVTHGGMGTVVEALRSGTPLVAVPTSALDRPTARRIEELGLGVALDPATVTGPDLVAAVTEVLGGASYADRAAAMAEEIAASGGAVKAADEIERVAQGIEPRATAGAER